MRSALRERIDLPDPWPVPGQTPSMIPEAWFLRAIDAVRDLLPPERAEAVLRRAGSLTARYVARHRIPRAFRWLLRWLPDRWALQLLLSAFERHAWTFAGSGTFRVVDGLTLSLTGCPTCRPAEDVPHLGDVSGFSGAYYEAAFEDLIHLAAPRALVREVQCAHVGAPDCRFEILLSPQP